MKRLAAIAIALALAPLLIIGLLAATYAMAGLSGNNCLSPSATSTSAGQLNAPNAGLIADDPSACAPTGDLEPATPFSGPDELVADPTSRGRITRRMLHVYNEVQRVFNGWKWGIGCWDPHTWNPTSDHPLGRACDFAVGHIGIYPTPAQQAVGWQLAHWAQANAQPLGISYIIYHGHIWSPTRARDGWRPYNGGGIYDPHSITGGHYDHIHISVEQAEDDLER